MDSIPPSWHIARLSLLGRPSRTILVGVSVALASTLVVTISCAFTTALTNIEARMGTLIGEADARVVHQHGAEFDASELELVRTLPNIVAAAGRLSGSISVRRADGAVDSQGRELHATLQCKGTDLAEDRAFDQVKYTVGRAPESENEIGIDPLAAGLLNAQPGTVLSVIHFGDPVQLTVTGVLERPTLGALQRPKGHLSRRVLAAVNDRDGDVSIISIVLQKGVDTNEWVKANAAKIALPLRLENIELAKSGLDRPTRGSEIALAVATMLGFLCCSFIVATAMTTAIGEQQRMFAMARCIGASRSQLFCGQLFAGAALCLIAGTAGIPLGIATIWIATEYYREMLPAGLSVSWTGIVLAIIGSTAAGIIGAMWPAWKASRVSVLRALGTQVSAASVRGIWIAGGCGLGCIAIQLSLLTISDQESRFWGYVLGGLPLLHIAFFVLSVPTLWIVGRILSPWLESFLRIPKGLLSGSLAANPWRFGLVAGALMVGVSVLVSTWTNGNAILSDISERIRFGDAFVFKSTGFSSAETNRLRTLPGVTSAAAVGYLPLKIIGQQVLGLDGLSTPNVVCIGFDSEPFLQMNRLEWIKGDPIYAAKRLRDGNAILVAEEFLTARGIGPGTWIELGSESDHHPFEVVGVVGAAGLDVATQFFGIQSMYMEHAVSCVFMDFSGVSKNFGTREAFLVQMGITEEATTADEEKLATAVESATPGAIFASGRAIRKEILRIGAIMLTVSTFVALGAMALASLAAGGVIAAGIATRSFELGVLEAVGASRGLVSRLILTESLLIGITAGITGSAFGIYLAWMGTRCYRDMAGLELSFKIPVGVVVGGFIAASVAAILAAAPAVRSLTRRSPRELLGGPKG